MKKNNQRIISIAVAMLITLAGAGSLYALRAPHDYPSNGINCGSCHKLGAKIRGIQPLCVSECHNTSPTAMAKRKALDVNFGSNVFGTFTNVGVGKKLTSHAWSTQPNYSTAGKNNRKAGTNKTITLNQVNVKGVTGTSTIICSKCHYAHGAQDSAIAGSGGTINSPFIRVSTKGNFICFQCHEERRVSNVRDPLAAGKAYSHPVEVNYSSIAALKPDLFEHSPTNPYPTAAGVLPLYTTYGNVKGAVVCSTCHGPMHSADSNPYTFDNMSAFSMGQYSASSADGRLLRRYGKSKDVNNDLCRSCHKVTTHRSYNCYRCHTPHKRQGENNRYLILENISTPYNGKRPVQFISTSVMASRFAAGYSTAASRFSRPVSNRICQVCHMNTKWHKNYSAIGSTGKNREGHATPNEYLGSGKYKNCTQCHEHGSGFALGGAACGSCHGNTVEGTPYPADTFGKHEKHVGKNTGASYGWSGGTLSDSRQAGEYGFSCGRCHTPWIPYTASGVNVLRHAGPAPGTLKNYTADFGFKNGTPLPQNPAAASYSPGARGSEDTGATGSDNYKFSTPSAGSCINLYCHGQFFGGYTGNNPVFNGANARQSCNGGTGRVCHGTNATNIPGSPSENGTPVGAHRRHVGNGAQQYGQGLPNFRCNACHNATVEFNIQTSVTDKRAHVNGRINLRFAGAYGDGASRYDTFNDYSVSPNAAGSPKAYKTCGLIYCHSDGSRTLGNYSAPFNANIGTGAGKYPNWSSIKNFTTTLNVGGKTFKRRCSRCHGNSTYVGITAAMPGVTSKGNSHSKHIINGFLCNVCHSGTVNTDNKSIASTTLHVNKAYEISILTKYGSSASYDSGTRRCSNVTCHGGRLTAQWGDQGRCQECHFKSSAEAAQDEGYSDNYAFKNYTDATSVPRVYSTEWSGRGHGSSAAAKVCTDCHKASGSISHKSEIQSNNPFRVFTSPAHLDDLCLECHSDGRSKSAQAVKKVLGHTQPAMDGWGDAVWAFVPKCIDCHDPHGDNNRYMIQKFVNITGSDTYGKIANSNYARQVTFTTVGGGLMNWSSYVKSDFSGLCQRCHNTQANMDHFNKNTLYDTTHNAQSRCTSCHKHDSGFKGMDCGGCHNFPPTLSGKHAFHVATTVTKSYVSYDVTSTKTKYAFGCGKCHDSGTHYVGLSGNYTTEVKFDNANYPKNDINGYVFGARSSIDQGADGPSGYSWTSTKGTCQNLYCHGEFAGGNTGNDPLWYGTSVCGNCHGAAQASAPYGGAHVKHVNAMGYDCRNCHDDTVDAGVNTPNLKNKVVHVDGKTQYKLYTAWSARIGGAARYNGNIFGRATTEVGSATYGYCQNIYCHSKGTNTTNPYNVASAYPNYTAKWGQDMVGNFPNAGERCSYCHGNKQYKGITSAMPNQAGQAHKIHVVDNNITRCFICHANVVNSGNQIIGTNNHVNQFKNISIIMTYRSGGLVNYAAPKTCENITCHGGKKTPAWTATGINCKDCHYANSADVMSYSFSSYSETASVPTIYSSEWAESGHGKTSGNYRVTGRAVANKNCGNCHVSSVKHNTGTNFFRLTGLGGGTDPSALCKRCHGTTGERQVGFGGGFGTTTGIKGHTQQILSSEGYSNLTTWRFKPKCTDCHDPHGDARATSGNIAMIRNTVLYNHSGSDSSGRPIRFPSLTTVNFTKYNGTTSFDDSSSKGRVCAVCHKRTAHNGSGNGHANEKLDCRTCHKHKQGFTPAGCTGCHGDDAKQFGRASWSPPKGPSTPQWSDSMTNRSSLHLPHAYNPKGRPGFLNQTGFACEYCHDDSVPAASGHNTGKVRANMNNLTSTTGWSGRNKQSKIGFGVDKAPADNTCWNTSCHTPRAYNRTWQKPKDCDDCHGYTKGRGTSGLTGRQFNLQTTQSHKIHINWTGVATPPASWKKNYKFACSNCHYDPADNYSTHYSGLVNITSAGTVNTVGGQFYTRGRSFKGFTSGNESLGTCSKTYCHGNFATGTTIVKPNWKKGVTTMNCGSCHRAKTAKVAGWSDGTLMPAPHPTHVNSATYNFSCARCHNWTVTNNTTVQFTYSSHVNTRKDVNFDNTSGTFTNSSKRMCQNNYCHSSGATVVPRTVSNYTADWLDGAAVNKTGAGKGCSYCHGSKGNGFGGITAAMPNYANQAHAKHARNATGDSFRCNVCHASTVNTAGQIISVINHVNKFKNISVISAYKSGATNYGAPKTCANIKCHGGMTTPAWTSTANCMDCHKGVAGDTDKRISVNNTFQGYSEAVPKIYTGQWLTRGHGRPTASGNYPVSNNSAANKTCTACHGSGETRAAGLSTKHGNSAANPFRLITAPNRPNVLCESCHGTNATNPGKGTMVGIQSHASSVTAGGGNGFSYWMKCIDCHDPHGDNNIQMLHSTIARPSAALAKKESSNQFGSLFFNATGRNVDFVNNLYTSDYAKKTASPKVCQVCHSQTFKPNSSAQRTRFRWDGSSETAHGAGKCTSCHGHNQGFKGVKCDACHGNPPTSKFNMLTSTTNGEKWPFSGTTSAGAHNRHVQLFGSDSNTCAFCHQQGMYNSGASNDNIDIGFKAFGIYTGKYTGKAGVRSGWYGYSGVGITTGNTARCEVQCHGQKGWLTASYSTPTAPLWENNKRTATCGKCHGAKKAATQGSWPTTGGHVLHAGFGSGRLDYMCKLCHENTVQGNATTLSASYHVNAVANVAFGPSADPRADANSSYIDSNSQVNSAIDGRCTNTYCHSKGTDSDMVAPYNNTADYANWTATWNVVRGSYKQANGVKAKCNYCHGNKTWSGTTSAMPNYTDGTPKANKHVKHVRTYNFLCNACHVDVVKNNTSITSTSLHINRTYEVNYTTVRGIVNNSAGSYYAGRCENVYCHSSGNTAAFALPNYTAKWSSNLGGYQTGQKCKYCHGAKSIPFTGMTAAMPNYPTGTKANAHNRHVAKYGFTCTECHMKVTANNSSIDAAAGIGLHVNKQYDVYFKPAIAGRPQINNTGVYRYQSGATGSSCKNTYCHSRGTDFVRPYSTRTSFSTFTAQWGDNVGGYKKPAGQKAKCNYCHGNKVYSGSTSAMPNYSTQIKKNSHKKHVVSYGFTCKACHKYVTNNNSSIDAAGGIGRHVNGSYNVDFSNSFNNNTGLYSFIAVNSLNRCKNTYCHSRGTDFAKPFNTRTSFSNFTAMWGDSVESLGYKKPAGQKAKCNYCHGDKRFSGTTSAMPNYSGNFNFVKAKANSHRVHVIGNGFTCKECHYGVVPNNTSITDRVRHTNAFYNISFAPGNRGQAGKMYSSVWGAGGVQGTLGGTCKNTTCHGSSTPKWGDPNTASCKACHLSATQADVNSFGQPNDGKIAGIYSTEWGQKGHGSSAAGLSCANCHNSGVSHGNEAQNPYRLYTSNSDRGCLNCHGVLSERNKAQWNNWVQNKYTGIATHSMAVMGGDAQWSFPDAGAKCVDCHDPHGDKNRKMIHAQINYSGSDRFGRPALPPTYGTVTSTAAIQMTFTAFGGQLNWSSFANNNVNRSICRRCHTTGVAGLGQNMNKTQYAAGHQSDHTQKCTACHSHKSGFKGGGESSGGESCATCHSSIFNPMSSQRSYHHVMQNTSSYLTGNKGYPTGNNLTATDSRRRCLMCHVDHDIFRTDSEGRAANLRANINDTPAANSGVRSDWSGTDTKGGICLSCHTIAQTKNTARQINDKSVTTLRISTSQYRQTPHNYTAIGVIATDSSRFKANCLKCHNDTMPKTKFVNSSTTGFGLHDSKLRRLNAKLGVEIASGSATRIPSTTRLVDNTKSWTAGKWNTRVVTITAPGKVQTRAITQNSITGITVSKAWSPTLSASDTYTIGDPVEEDYCYNCHSPANNPNYAAGKDYYGMVSFVNKKALKMEKVFTGEANTATGGTSGAAPTVVRTGAGWQTGYWTDFAVTITSGTGAGQKGVVTGNTTDTLSITASTSWKKVPDATSKYSVGNPYKHRIENFAGIHKSDEAISAPAGVSTFGWFTAIGAGYKPHVGCTDCHNPHAQKKPGVDRGTTDKTTLTTNTTLYIPGKSWTTNSLKGYLAVAIDRSNAGEERMIVGNTADRLRVGAPFSAKMTGVYITVYPKGRANVNSVGPGAGNMLNGPNNGQWGVKVVSWRKPLPSTTNNFENLSSPVMSKMTTIVSGTDKVYNICFKCHSRYAWGTSGKPFNIQNAFTTAGTTPKFREGPSADIASRFNPNNLAHHAVVAPGNNQPIVLNYGFTNQSSYYAPNWPAYKTATVGHSLAISAGAATLAGGAKLPMTVIPGWYVYVGSDTPNTKTDGTAQAGTASTGWVQITAITSDTAFTVTPAVTITTTDNWAISAGLGNAFVPPLGPWSVIGCADCHDTSSSADPGGPHGSGFRWILRGMEPQTFPWFNGTNVIKVSWSNLGWISASTAQLMCLNCHRADVYGNEGNIPNDTLNSTTGVPVTTDDPANWSNFSWKNSFSRQQHPADVGSNSYDDARSAATIFGINCMMCHAGRTIGEIHGTNMGDSYDTGNARVTSNAGKRGKRFLTGGNWIGVRRGTVATVGACWSDDANVPDAINSCNDKLDGSAMRTVATYNFDGGADY